MEPIAQLADTWSKIHDEYHALASTNLISKATEDAFLALLRSLDQDINATKISAPLFEALTTDLPF